MALDDRTMRANAYGACAARAVTQLYDCVCSIEIRKPTRQGGRTSFTSCVAASDVRCRLSYGAFNSVSMHDGSGKRIAQATLFLPPEIELPVGSVITVTEGDGKTRRWAFSGELKRYRSHAEAAVRLADTFA